MSPVEATLHLTISVQPTSRRKGSAQDLLFTNTVAFTSDYGLLRRGFVPIRFSPQWGLPSMRMHPLDENSMLSPVKVITTWFELPKGDNPTATLHVQLSRVAIYLDSDKSINDEVSRLIDVARTEGWALCGLVDHDEA
ncbi:hypothetical protein IT415_03510 [bacterium]|nr:hypothetical protein [bacterium]